MKSGGSERIDSVLKLCEEKVHKILKKTFIIFFYKIQHKILYFAKSFGISRLQLYSKCESTANYLGFHIFSQTKFRHSSSMTLVW